MMTPLKMFGTGQVTLPKIWREKVNAKYFITEETPRGLLIKPLVESFYYETDEEGFGVNFPTGISAKKLLSDLKKANAQLH